MAANFQQRSRVRKLIYLGMIVLLFTVSLLHRQLIIEPAAYALQLRADTQGEVELTSSAVRVLMFGSRGIAASVLWNTALEKQKRHQWNELELVVKSITTLQPNFVTPWLFQSWNLAFNVSVECDRTRDKYFYISRGIQLLAEGERRHQGSAVQDSRTGKKFPGNPDMRFHLGGYYLRKIGLSDDRNAMRSLFELSCIDPLQRDPNQFWPAEERGRGVNLKKFQEFSQQNPRLVRRLKRRLRCSEPRDVVAFLERNQGIPTRFDEADTRVITNRTQTPLLPPEQQFPILPPPINRHIPDREERQFEDAFDVFVATRAWYGYAQEPLPPPSPNLDEQDEVDMTRYRLPKMMTFLFRSFLPRSQEYVAEGLQEEGFYDAEGWVITRWFAENDEDETTVTVGRESKYHSTGAWDLAFDMYKEYGVNNGILLPAGQQEALEEEARLFRLTYVVGREDAQSPLNLDLGSMAPEARRKMEKSRDAYVKLSMQDSLRSMSNFDAHYHQCRTERLPEIAGVRKLFFQADELEMEGNPTAIAVYHDALSRWLAVMLHYPEYRTLEDVQKETYQWEQQYLGLLEAQNEELLKPLTVGVAQLGVVPFDGGLAWSSVPVSVALRDADRRRIVPLRQVSGPMEWVYLLEFPARRELQDLLLGVTQAAQPVPLALSAYQRDWMLTAVSLKDRRQSGAEFLSGFRAADRWAPLISSDAISGEGYYTRLERRLGR